MMALLNAHSVALLLIITLALILFAQEKVRLETSSLLVLFVLSFGFQVFPFIDKQGNQFDPIEFYQGFGHEALLTICALMILGRGIETSGALKPFTALLTAKWSKWPTLCLFFTVVTCAVLSSFLNNTPIVVMLIPVLISIANSVKQSPSKLLMPVGLATLIGGTATTIGTSTNLLIVSLTSDLNVTQFNIFDFALPVIAVGGVGLIYLVFVAPLLLPERELPLNIQASRLFKAMLMLNDNSVITGKQLNDALQMTDYEMKISRIVRGQNQLVTLPTVMLKSGDGLIVTGTAEQLLEFGRLFKAQLYNLDDNKNPISPTNTFASDEQVLAEVLVTAGSVLENRTLKQSRFAEMYELVAIALHRLHEPDDIRKSVPDVVLKQGDILLVQGKPEKIQELQKGSRLLVLNNTINVTATDKAPLALTVMLGVIACAALQILPISMSAMAGVIIMLLTRCINWREIGASLNPPVIMIIVVSLALGKAMVVTGADKFLGHTFVWLTEGFPLIAILASLIFLMSLLTNMVSNTAAAVIGTPVAISIAHELGVPPEAFVLAVLFGVNMSYATPIGYQTNLLIFSVGGYKFGDFVRVGVPLTLIMGTGFTIALALIYGIWT